MKVVTKDIALKTKGDPELVDLTGRIEEILKKSNLKDGAMTVFIVGSTAAITTFEYEPGLVKDMQDIYEKIIPRARHYNHDETWGDANGFSHIRAALQGPSITIPFEDGTLALGRWQQVVLAEFDNRSRERRIVVQMIGE